MHHNHYVVKVVYASAASVIFGEINYRITLMPLFTIAIEWCGHVQQGMHHNHYFVKVVYASASFVIFEDMNYKLTFRPLTTEC